MANRIDPLAHSIKGTDPRHLIEKITREKVYGCVYWKQECFGLTAASVVDKAVALKYVGGTFGGNRQPTPFLCLVLKLLQLQPEKEIILEYIRDAEFKYLRALGAYYLRLTGKTEEVFSELEPFYNDYRKIAVRTTSGWKLSHMDEYIDDLLQEEFVCDIQLPHIPKRTKLEDNGILEPRVSALEKDLNLDGLEDYEDSSENSDGDEDRGEEEEDGDDGEDGEIKAAKLFEKTSNTRSSEEGATKSAFIATDRFSGVKKGYAFTNGKLGLGYYLDSNNDNSSGSSKIGNGNGDSNSSFNGNNNNMNSNSNHNSSFNSNNSSNVANKLVNPSRGVDNRPSWMTTSDSKTKTTDNYTDRAINREIKGDMMEYDDDDNDNNDNDDERRSRTGDRERERGSSSSAGGSDRVADTLDATRSAASEAPDISIESDRIDRSLGDYDRRNNDRRRSRSRDRDRGDRDRYRGDRDRIDRIDSRDRRDSRDSRDRGSRKRDDRSRDRKDRRRSRSRSRSESRGKRRRSRSSSRDGSRNRSKRDDSWDRHSREKSYDNIHVGNKASRGMDNDPALMAASGVHDLSGASSIAVCHPATSASSASASSTSSKGGSKSSTSKFDRMFGKTKTSSSDAGNNSSSNNGSSGSSSSGNSNSSQSTAGSKRITLSNDVVVETSAPEGSQEYWNAIRQGYGMKTLK